MYYDDEAGPEGFIDRSVPADERGRAEEDKPEDGETQVDAVLLVCNEVGQTRQQVQEERHAVICTAPRYKWQMLLIPHQNK